MSDSGTYVAQKRLAESIFKGTMKKWPVQKQTQPNTKNAE